MCGDGPTRAPHGSGPSSRRRTRPVDVPHILRIPRLARLTFGLIGVGTVVALFGGPAAPDPGDAEAGRAVFVDKQCARCHLPEGTRGAGPALEQLRRPQGEMELAGRLWNHVPAMAQALTEAGFEWPKLTETEMANLMVYLGAAARRDPEPDLHRGELVLLRKGCLKCHSLRQEGGRVKPDLGERRADYGSASAWAATMWAHTPAMSQMSTRLGIAYPRFSGDEMRNLVGFLKHTAEGGKGGAR